jgi:hypothetical protein
MSYRIRSKRRIKSKRILNKRHYLSIVLIRIKFRVFLITHMYEASTIDK